MFGASLECGIHAVTVKSKDVDGRPVRRCKVTLAHEFDVAIARELGKEAEVVRKGMRHGAIDKAIFPIDGLAAMGVFGSKGDKVNVGRMVGVRATAMKPKTDDAGPTVHLEFEFAWQEDAWLFLGRNCNAVADVVLTKRQLALALDDAKN